MGLASIVSIVSVLPAFFQAITALMQLAETLFSGQGQGVIKKDWVMASIGGVIEAMPVVATGGAKESWEAISSNWPTLSIGVSSIIDFLTGILFPKVQSVMSNAPTVIETDSTKPAWDREDQ